MAKIPEATPGLVFRYGYLRIRRYEQGQIVGKERPCCILIPFRRCQILLGHPLHIEERRIAADRHVADDGEVLILPIQSDPPDRAQIGLQMTTDEKRHVGLPDQAPSYIVVSEANIDRWPNGDTHLLPGTANLFAYPRTLTGPFLSRVVAASLRVQDAGKLRVLLRHP
jgi:hypothetical protein